MSAARIVHRSNARAQSHRTRGTAPRPTATKSEPIPPAPHHDTPDTEPLRFTSAQWNGCADGLGWRVIMRLAETLVISLGDGGHLIRRAALA
jgi:hypothetical protein